MLKLDNVEVSADNYPKEEGWHVIKHLLLDYCKIVRVRYNSNLKLIVDVVGHDIKNSEKLFKYPK